MNKKTTAWILGVIIVFLLPVIIYLGNYKAVAFNINFYEKEFAKYDPEVENSVEITNDLLYFLRYKDNDEKYVAAFEKDEIAHLIDAKKVMHKFLLILNIVGIILILTILLLYFTDKDKFIRYLGAGLSLGGILTLVLSLVLYGFIKNFNWAFVKFHELFFAGNWRFPDDYLLIRLFPEQFWMDITSKIMSNVMITANILIVIGVIMLVIFKSTIRGGTK